MLSPVVQSVVQMGFDASLVESLVQTKYLLTGQQYTSVSDLVSDVLQAEQEDRQRGPQSRGKRHLNHVSRATPSDLFFAIFCWRGEIILRSKPKKTKWKVPGELTSLLPESSHDPWG